MAVGFIAAGALLFVVIPILLTNPFASTDAGLPFFNRQLIVYGLPALGFFLVARELESQAPIQRVRLLPVWGVVGLFVIGILLLVSCRCAGRTAISTTPTTAPGS